MSHPEKSLQATIKDGVLVTSASRQQALSYLLDLHQLLDTLPVKWHNVQMTSKGVYIRVTLKSNHYISGSGKDVKEALYKLKRKMIFRGVISLLPNA